MPTTITSRLSPDDVALRLDRWRIDHERWYPRALGHPPPPSIGIGDKTGAARYPSAYRERFYRATRANIVRALLGCEGGREKASSNTRGHPRYTRAVW